MAARPPYRPGQALTATAAAQAFADALADQLRAYRANVTTWGPAGWTKGYHLQPSVALRAIDGTGAALVRYIPAPCRDLRAAWGDTRNPALDLTQDAALTAAAERLQRDGWECEFQPDRGETGSYLPALIVRKKGPTHE